MPLEKLGPYKLEKLLGRGGMVPTKKSGTPRGAAKMTLPTWARTTKGHFKKKAKMAAMPVVRASS